MTYFPDLLEEYKQLLKHMKLEGITSGELHREVKQAIDWMETGYDPAEVRASNRIDAYPIDPYHMQTYMAYVNDEDMLMPEYLKNLEQHVDWELRDVDPIQEQSYINRFRKDLDEMVRKAESRKKKLNGAMSGLTADEKAVYVAIEGEMLPFSKVADMLGVCKGTVQGYYNRARRKIKRNITKGTQESLFDDIA